MQKELLRVGELPHRLCPKVSQCGWVDDHQGGGFVEYVTDIEYARRMKILDTIDEDGNGEERIDWE